MTDQTEDRAPGWVDITRTGSAYEEEMWLSDGAMDPRRDYRHRLRPFILGTTNISDWEPGMAPDNPYWPDRDKDKP